MFDANSNAAASARALSLRPSSCRSRLIFRCSFQVPLWEVHLVVHGQQRPGMGIKCHRHVGQGQVATAFRQRSTCLGNGPRSR